eukprot:m.25836 g.25836  ORF g.25836 m.25836 type:complete len:69 (+) comp37840_c0_seq3:791-997(+)
MPDVVEELGLSADHLMLVVHSGSRGLGQEVLAEFADESGANCLDDDAERRYLARYHSSLVPRVGFENH